MLADPPAHSATARSHLGSGAASTAFRVSWWSRALAAAFVLVVLADTAAAREDLAAVYARARAAHDRGDWPAFLEASRTASAMEPHSTRLLYNVACAEARAGHAQPAVAILERLARMGASFDLDADPDLASLHARPGFVAARQRMQALKDPVVHSTVAFRLDERDLLTEGMAHDPRTGRFFLGSVRKRKIVEVAKDGRVRDFVPAGSDGLFAVFGLRADPSRRLLWACSTAMAPMEGLRPEDAGHAALYAFDLDTGKVRTRVDVPGPGPHNLDDLTVDAAGRVYASDPGARTVLVLDPGARAFRTLVQTGPLASPQGLALSPGERWLYVADYVRGIARVDPTSGDVRWLDWPDDALPVGIDGILSVAGGMVAIQNGVPPARVTRLTLSPDGLEVVRAETLDRNHPLFSEPTLGVLVGDAVYYVAASQWPAYGDETKPPSPESLKPSLVLKLDLSY